MVQARLERIVPTVSPIIALLLFLSLIYMILAGSAYMILPIRLASSPRNIVDVPFNTNFIATLNFDYLVSYTDIKCRLWKPLNEKLWLFCKLNDSLRSEIDYIKIKEPPSPAPLAVLLF